LYREKVNNLYISTNTLTIKVIISRRLKIEWKLTRRLMWRKKTDIHINYLPINLNSYRTENAETLG
jgi:hypothetical protein